jgi:hypothetical protein
MKKKNARRLALKKSTLTHLPAHAHQQIKGGATFICTTVCTYKITCRPSICDPDTGCFV